MKFGMAKVPGGGLCGATHAELTPQDIVSCQMILRGAMMLEYGLRFLAGGIAVSAFAAISDTLRPRSFAGLFGAAPSIALATLLITLSQKGAPFAAVEGRSMIVGAFALATYSWMACVLLKKFLLSSWTATMAALVIWFVVALGLSAALFQLS
jgi:hypothetical protein